MAAGYEAAEGMRGMLSGTPPILAMIPLVAGLELIEQVGMPAIRAKSLRLTEFALELADEWLTPLGVNVVSPRDADRRAGHITLQRKGFRSVLEELWKAGVIPDYREPDGIRIGLAPLSTSFTELHRGMRIFRDVLTAEDRSEVR
jgi:kynureninase